MTTYNDIHDAMPTGYRLITWTPAGVMLTTDGDKYATWTVTGGGTAERGRYFDPRGFGYDRERARECAWRDYARRAMEAGSDLYR